MFVVCELYASLMCRRRAKRAADTRPRAADGIADGNREQNHAAPATGAATTAGVLCVSSESPPPPPPRTHDHNERLLVIDRTFPPPTR